MRVVFKNIRKLIELINIFLFEQQVSKWLAMKLGTR
jgi:hypothetical protein